MFAARPAATRTLCSRRYTWPGRNWRRFYSAEAERSWRTRRWRQTAAVAAVSAGVCGYAIYNYDTAYLVAASVYRSSVAASATCQIAWDYYRNFPELPPEDDASISEGERRAILATRSAVHLRAAEKVKRALMKNGGVYIKLGQHVSAMQYVLPMEWCQTMQALQDQNTASSLEEIGRVIAADTGQTIEELFSAFDAEPIGVASLAQVHRAELRVTGEEVAVKVQHPMVRTYSDIDIATVSVMFEFVHSVFPDFKFMWLSAEMKGSLPRELDFRNDKSNAEQVQWNFSTHPEIPLAVPRMVQATERVLIMEYVHGRRCDDLTYLRKHAIDPAEVSRAIGQVFAEMTYVHGFLHCDPHPGNLFVRSRPRGSAPHGRNFDLVLLDHGLYRQLSSRFRYEYAEMWHALMRGDQDRIKYWSRQLSGTDLYRLFAIILTGQNWSTIEAKSLSRTTAAAQFNLDELMEQQPDLFRKITEVLSSVPPVLLLVLKTNDLLRMVDQRLFADQPPLVQQHAQLRTWLQISTYCLRTIRDARAADIGYTPSTTAAPADAEDMDNLDGSAASQTDMFTTPRHDGRTNSSANRTMITTTVVGQRGQRAFVSGAKRQKIPGPAGLIETSVASGAPSTQKPTSPFRTPLSRRTHSEQSSNVDFEGGTWAAMLDHLHLPAYTPATAKTVTRTAEAAEWPIRRVLEATHTQRVRIMLVQLREMGSSDADASVSLVDPTGEMRASIHRPVMKRFVHFLAAGTSIILKDVVALKLPGVQPFLTITAASIEQIFTSKGAGTSENPIMLTATQAPADTPTQAPADRLEPAVSDSSPPALPSQADKTHGASDGEPDLLGSSGFLDNEDEDAFSDLLDPSQ
ncbi:hypothetical protein H4S01_002590 [Coemansia sp. RSA 2610]|nr:hypothetical protein H4S01_002590 [Coemansia sp. RSA 2610]